MTSFADSEIAANKGLEPSIWSNQIVIGPERFAPWRRDSHLKTAKFGGRASGAPASLLLHLFTIEYFVSRTVTF
jgi:hypothetical protein